MSEPELTPQEIDQRVRRATPKLLKLINPKSATGAFLHDVQRLQPSPADGQLRVSDIFVSIAQGKGLQLFPEETALLQKTDLTRRGFGGAVGGFLAGGLLLGGFAYRDRSLQKEVDQIDAKIDDQAKDGTGHYEANIYVGNERGAATARLTENRIFGTIGTLLAAAAGAMVGAAMQADQTNVEILTKHMDAMLQRTASQNITPTVSAPSRV